MYSKKHEHILCIFQSVGLIRRAPAIQCYSDDVCSSFPIDFSSLLAGISWTANIVCYEIKKQKTLDEKCV